MHFHGQICNKPDTSLNISYPSPTLTVTASRFQCTEWSDMGKLIANFLFDCVESSWQFINNAFHCALWRDYCSPVFWKFEVTIHLRSIYCFCPSMWQGDKLATLILCCVLWLLRQGLPTQLWTCSNLLSLPPEYQDCSHVPAHEASESWFLSGHCCEKVARLPHPPACGPKPCNQVSSLDCLPLSPIAYKLSSTCSELLLCECYLPVTCARSSGMQVSA